MITIAQTVGVKLKSKIMREIEFRVQVLDNSNQKYWIYIDLGKTIENPIATGFAHGNHVIKETVGQFTGLLDKNGKKIFEGDVIEEGVVYFDDEYLGYFVKGDFVEGEHKPLYDIPLPEIIGNITENPELLK